MDKSGGPFPEPLIRIFPETCLAGQWCRMSLSEDRTPELWSSFMPVLREAWAGPYHELFSLQQYPDGFDFSPHAQYVKWALAPRGSFEQLPEGVETFIIHEGLYAVFNYRGRSGNPAIFHHIFTNWLPNSGYHLDDRPHFEILGRRYNPFSDDSEEEICIPIRVKPV